MAAGQRPVSRATRIGRPAPARRHSAAQLDRGAGGDDHERPGRVRRAAARSSIARCGAATESRWIPGRRVPDLHASRRQQSSPLEPVDRLAGANPRISCRSNDVGVLAGDAARVGRRHRHPADARRVRCVSRRPRRRGHLPRHAVAVLAMRVVESCRAAHDRLLGTEPARRAGQTRAVPHGNRQFPSVDAQPMVEEFAARLLRSPRLGTDRHGGWNAIRGGGGRRPHPLGGRCIRRAEWHRRVRENRAGAPHVLSRTGKARCLCIPPVVECRNRDSHGVACHDQRDLSCSRLGVHRRRWAARRICRRIGTTQDSRSGSRGRRAQRRRLRGLSDGHA